MDQNPFIDLRFTGQDLGEIYMLLERLYIAHHLIDGSIQEFESILGIDPYRAW